MIDLLSNIATVAIVITIWACVGFLLWEFFVYGPRQRRRVEEAWRRDWPIFNKEEKR